MSCKSDASPISQAARYIMSCNEFGLVYLGGECHDILPKYLNVLTIKIRGN